MAIWITLAGLAVTAVVIVLFMPKYSYWAAAYGHLASYIVMFAISAVLGAKYYPIPYRWGRLAGIVLVMGTVYGLSTVMDNLFFNSEGVSTLLYKFGAHTMLIILYLGAVWALIKQKRK